MPDPSAPPPIPPTAWPAQLSQEEIDGGKVMAILSYIPVVGVIVSIVALAIRDNAFSLYHAKQALLIWIIVFVASYTVGVFHFFYVFGSMIRLLAGVCDVFGLVAIIIGLINSSAGQCKPLPLVGVWAEQWFASIRKK